MQKNPLRYLWIKIISLVVIGIIIITYSVPAIFNKNTVNEATLAAKNTAQQYSQLRRYYTKNVVRKLADEMQTTASSDYKNKRNSIPLPATMIHELSELSESNGVRIKLYSAYPFPERASRTLDHFQQEAWQQLNKQANKPYVATETSNGNKFVRVAIADILTEQACVDCHNNHPLTPKTDWKLGDVRGVLEVIVPINKQLSGQKNNSYKLTIAMLLIFIVIFIILFLLLNNDSKRRVRKVLVPLNNQKFAINAHSLVSMAELDGTITYVNDKFIEISGYSKAELIGEKHNFLNSNNQPKAYWKNMHDTVLAGNIWHDAVRNRAKAGHYYWVDTTIVPNLSSGGDVIGFTSIRTDITQQKQTLANLATAKEQAEVASVSKADFLANMSHEIRTPMNGVIGMTNLLLESNLTSEQQKLAQTVKSSGEGLLTIINDILDFSKVEAGKLELEIIPFNLGRMIEDIGTTMSYQSHMKGLQLICPASPIIQQWVKSDPGRIRQILTNLIGNAIKFTEKGEVAVYVNLVAENNNKKTFRFEIRDSGIGINEAQQKLLFDKFSQADNSTTRKYGGTGLGLSISKKLVELMKGEIGVTSQVGRGSSFWFTLPMLTAEMVDEPILCSSKITNERILIVDDNETNLELMHQLHKIWGIPHTLVNNAQAAITELTSAKAENNPYTIAILDMHMPKMDGLGLCDKIKKNPTLAGTKLIMASSQAQRGDALITKDAGFKGYISKPIQQSELFDVLLMVANEKEETAKFVTRHSVKELVQFKAHVLVVEDNRTNQLVIEGVLKSLGLTVDIAADGMEAISALQSYGGHDLIFMDCQMPVLDGYQATKKIRSKQSGVTNSNIAIIAMTANAMAGDKQKCLDAGMDDYLSKPLDPIKIITMLKKWLPVKETIIDTQVDTKVIENTSHIEQNNDQVIFDYQDMSIRLMHDPELMKSIAEIFWQDVAAQLSEVKEYIASEDIVNIAAIMHKIRGSSANVGGLTFSNLALAMESAGKAGDIDFIKENISQLEHDFNMLQTAMQKHFHNSEG